MKSGAFKSSRRFWASFLVFLCLLGWFYFSHQNVITPMLLIKYDAQPKAVVDVYWDSGKGFNDREHNVYLLYSGEKQLSDLPLPRERISAVKLVTRNCTVLKAGFYDWANNGKVITLPIQNDGDAVLLGDIKASPGKDSITFPVQVTFAAFLALLFYVVASRINSLDRTSAGTAVCKVFSGRRRLFWLLFVSFAIWWLFWLWCEWPGILTRDSYYFTLREIAVQEFDGICPVSYNLLIMALFQIYNSPAVVAVVQILATAFLAAHIFYRCLLRGANHKIVVIFALMLFFSIPVAAYNLLLVKDIAYSLLAVFFGYLLYLMYSAQAEGRRLFINNAELVLCGILLALLSAVRYNGLAYIFLVPLAILLLRLLDIRRWLIFALAAAVLFGGLTIVSRNIQKVAPASVDAFFSNSATIGPAFSVLAGTDGLTENEKTIIARAMPVEEIKRRYTPVPRPDAYGNLVIKLLGMEPEALAEYNKVCRDLIWRHPLQVLDDRLQMFAGALGLHPNVYIFTDETQTHDGYVYWRPLESFKYDKHPGSFGVVSGLVNRLMLAASQPPWSLWIFNSVPSLLLSTAALVTFRRKPAAALFAAIILVNVPQLFAALSTCEWRMYYYIYLAGFFILPLWLAERQPATQ